MKTSVWDYLLSALFTTVIGALALAGVALLVAPLTRQALGSYHVIADLAALLLLYGVLSALTLRTLLALHPLERGEFAMDSPVFTYWKLLTVIYRLGMGALKPLTPIFLKPLIEVLFGARIGSDVALGGTIDDPYLVTIGNGVVLGNASLVSGNVIANGRIRIGEITIKDGATVGANSIVLPGCRIDENAVVMAGAMVVADSHIAAGETWRGNPARKWV